MPDDHLRRDDHLWQRQAAQRLAAHKKGHGSALCHWRVESQRHRVASQSRAPRDARNAVEGQHRPHLSRQIRPDCRNQMSKDRQILATRRAFPQIFAKPVRKPLRQPHLAPGEVASATGRQGPNYPACTSRVIRSGSSYATCWMTSPFIARHTMPRCVVPSSRMSTACVEAISRIASPMS
jgi:hypothetical protein